MEGHGNRGDRVRYSVDYPFKQPHISQLGGVAKFYIRYQEGGNNTELQNKKHSNAQQHQQNKQRHLGHSKPEHKIRCSIPSYSKPTESSEKMGGMRGLSNAPVDKIEKLKVRSSEREDLQSYQEYNRVPVEYYDERDNGTTDYIKNRIIFRGYLPKNTYFFLKSLKTMCRLERSALTQLPAKGPRNQYELKFQSKFESGNLSVVVRVNPTEYWLYMREDTNTHGLRQWYYFMVRVRKAGAVKFRIGKFSKPYSLYKQGMTPYIRVCNSSNNFKPTDWRQLQQKVKYEFDANQKCYNLEFTYEFLEENEEVEFSMLPPYTYSTLRSYLLSLVEGKSGSGVLPNNSTPKKSRFCPSQNYQTVDLDATVEQPKILSKEGYQIKLETIGSSLAGLQIPFLSIRQSEEQREKASRQAIFVTARTHPGETVSNFSLESFIERILQVPELLDYFDFFMIPMVNPDGVYFGNHRTSASGQDLNRNFQTLDMEMFPEVQAVHRALKRVRKTHYVRYMIDLHGHSARKNIFAYGQEHEIGSPHYLHSRVLPKLLSEQISSFKYNQCVFKESQVKKSTARVYFGSKFKINTLTFEQSYGLLDVGQIGITHWRNFGRALADSLMQFCRIYFRGDQSHRTRQQGKEALAVYLRSEMEAEMMLRKQRLLRHKKMLEISDQDDKAIPQSIEPSKDQNRSRGEAKRSDCESGSQECEQSLSQANCSELSSGQSSRELQNEELENLRKEVVKVGCMKQCVRRQKYNVADKRLEFIQSHNSIHAHRSNQLQPPNLNNPSSSSYNSFNSYIARSLQEHKSSTIPRMSKLEAKIKQNYRSTEKGISDRQKQLLMILGKYEKGDSRTSLYNKLKNCKVELPVIYSYLPNK